MTDANQHTILDHFVEAAPDTSPFAFGEPHPGNPIPELLRLYESLSPFEHPAPGPSGNNPEPQQDTYTDPYDLTYHGHL